MIFGRWRRLLRKLRICGIIFRCLFEIVIGVENGSGLWSLLFERVEGCWKQLSISSGVCWWLVMFRKINLVEDLLAAGRKGRGRSDIRQEDAQFLFDLLLLEPKERIVSKDHPAREQLRKRIGRTFKDPKFADVGYVVDPVDGCY